MAEETPNQGPVPIGERLFMVPSTPGGKPYLIGSKCRSCGEVLFPVRFCCRRCSSQDLEEVPLSRTAKLYSFTTIRVKPPHFIGQVPFMVGIVELPEKERIRTLLTECYQQSLKIGQEMELVIEPIGKAYENLGNIVPGTEVLGWKFRPVRGK